MDTILTTKLPEESCRNSGILSGYNALKLEDCLLFYSKIINEILNKFGIIS
jgi:hypothetical protein